MNVKKGKQVSLICRACQFDDYLIHRLHKKVTQRIYTCLSSYFAGVRKSRMGLNKERTGNDPDRKHETSKANKRKKRKKTQDGIKDFKK